MTTLDRLKALEIVLQDMLSQSIADNTSIKADATFMAVCTEWLELHKQLTKGVA